MKYTSTFALLGTLAAYVAADCTQVNGNWYCADTNAIQYNNIGYSGSYADVTNMDETSCQCSQSQFSFSGPMTPLDEELSVHFRGPLKLLQFGVYYPSNNNQKRDVEEDCTTTRHVHHAHKREAAVTYVDVTQTILVDSKGNTVSAGAAAAPAASSIGGNAQAVGGNTQSVGGNTPASSTSTTTTLSSTTSSSSSSSAAASSAAAGDWQRAAYFTPGNAANVVFMNHQGGTAGSGIWSACFGNSISYCASDGIHGAASPQALDGNLKGSNVEFMAFSGQPCNGNDCGYYRDGIPAHHGFGGAQKMFVFEFEMPHDTGAGGNNPDMPAIWLLNAKIPRTLQYGKAECSCWGTGCGEVDLFEILSSGSNNLISHIHDGQGNNGNSQGGGGSANYFQRPTSGSMKAAVIFNGNSITIVEVTQGNFDQILPKDVVQGWINTEGTSVSLP